MSQQDAATDITHFNGVLGALPGLDRIEAEEPFAPLGPDQALIEQELPVTGIWQAFTAS